jgi:hypothetical protein
MRHQRERLKSQIEPEQRTQYVPLYLRNLKEISIQSLDLPTIQHLLSEFKTEFGPRSDIHLKTLFPEFIPIDFSNTSQLMPAADWFPDQDFLPSIHGLHSHQRRVVIATVLGGLVNLTPKELLQVQIACSVNDIIRHDDRNLPISANHPQESAQWFQENIHLFKARGIKLTPEDISTISFLISTHELRFTELEPSLVQQIGSNLIKTHKDAIALDRFRLPKKKWWPKKEYLNLNESEKLLKMIGYYLLETEHQYHENPEVVNYQDLLLDVGETLGFFEPDSAEPTASSKIETETNTQDPWGKWLDHVKETTPLGHLYTQNSQLEQKRTQGKQHLVLVSVEMLATEYCQMSYSSAFHFLFVQHHQIQE